MVEKIIIYTDGSCSGNPGKGGWGAILLYKDAKKELSGYEEYTTNNRMELKAVIEALKAIKENSKIELYTDSNYVKEGISTWILKWKKNNWKTSDRKPVKNRDLWLELDELVHKHDVMWNWVKGHNGDKYNEEVDKIARNY
ncbi:MAG: ribonuclease HI [Rickettsiales bacterium]|nr:MAG: ribonuclease HI [Rickettsiales bacterium]